MDQCLWVSPSEVGQQLPETSAERFAQSIAERCQIVVSGLQVWKLGLAVPYDLLTEVVAVGEAAAESADSACQPFGLRWVQVAVGGSPAAQLTVPQGRRLRTQFVGLLGNPRASPGHPLTNLDALLASAVDQVGIEVPGVDRNSAGARISDEHADLVVLGFRPRETVV